MTDDRLIQDILDALAHTFGDRPTGPVLRDAYDAYRASITPQPVECLMSWWPDERPSTGGWSVTYPLGTTTGVTQPGEVWRVTITPIERVR